MFKGRITLPAALRVLFCFVVAGACQFLLAQADRATIEGFVTDSSGAAVGGAKVSVIRIETNDVTGLATNEAGRYFAANLPLGTYRVRVSSTHRRCLACLSSGIAPRSRE